MIRAIKKDGLWLINPPEILSRQLKDLLTFDNPKYIMHSKYSPWTKNPHSPKLVYWEEVNGNLRIPRNFIVHEYAAYLFEKYDVQIEDQTVNLPSVNLGTPITPRNEGQKRALDSMMSALSTTTDGLLIAPTGAGKTALMLEVARRLGLPTLWLTHRRSLMEQGAKRARKFLQIEPGFMGDGKWDIKPLTFGVVNTLARRDIEQISNMFGTVIIDEVHLFAAEYYLDQVFQLNPRYLLGTTATGNRRDGFFKLINYTVGNTLYEVPEEEAEILDPQINLIRMPEIPYKSTEIDDLRKELSTSPERNKKIVDRISTLLEDSRRRILVFAIDKAHAKLLQKSLQTSRPDAVIELIISDTKSSARESILDRASAGEVDVLITIKIAREGLDVPAMTTGFHTCPHDDMDRLAQEMGRIRRTEEGKDLCEWFDCVDFASEKAVSLAKRRLAFYKSKGFSFNK